jgi:hypothetical protein
MAFFGATILRVWPFDYWSLDQGTEGEADPNTFSTQFESRSIGHRSLGPSRCVPEASHQRNIEHSRTPYVIR